jgi:GMP synthase-like glutamine amidotransferase
VFGICLGAQLIANALGRAVYPAAQQEIGWWPVRKTEAGRTHPLFADIPETMTVFHWHGDTLDLPAGAVLLASSAACVNQAYAVGERILGLQFHFEVTPTAVRQMLVGEHGELLVPNTYVQTPDQILANIAHAEDNCRVMAALLEKLEAVARRG